MQTLKALATLCDTTLTRGDSDTPISGITLTSSKVEPGDMFAALPGLHVHGARFAADAADRGAHAILTDPEGADIIAAAGNDTPALLVVDDVRAVLGTVSAAIYDHPSDAVPVIGITGTSGKTTTAYLIESAFRTAGHSVGMIGTTGSRINGTRVPSSLTTPEAPDLQRLFATMRDAEVHRIVMEVSSHSLLLGRVAGTRFRIGAFLNLSQDHLDFHPTMEDYFLAKARLFTRDSGACCDRAVICVDDEWGLRMRDIAATSGCDPVTVSTTGPADYTAGPSTVADDGTQHCTLTDPRGHDHTLTLPMPGRFNVANALVALAVAEQAGLTIEDSLTGIASVVVPGRLQRIDEGQDFLAVVDYAHKPAAVAAVIAALRGEIKGRLAVVLGAGGDRDSSKRAIMGREAARGSDLLIVTDDNPRSEDPATIRAAVEAGALDLPSAERGEVRTIGDRAAAIRAAIAWAQPGDAILVAGKGHETGQEVNGVVHHFDDREEVQAALQERQAGTLNAANPSRTRTNTIQVEEGNA